MIRDDTDGLRDLDTRSFTQATTDAGILDMGLFHPADSNGDILQRAGAVTDTAGFSLIGETQALVYSRLAHLDIIEDRPGLMLNLLNSAGGTNLATFHAQDAGLFPWDQVRRIVGGDAVLHTEEFNTAVGAGLPALATTDTTTDELIFSQTAGRAQIADAGSTLTPPGGTDGRRRQCSSSCNQFL